MKTHPVRYANYWRVDIEHQDEDGFKGTTTFIAKHQDLGETLVDAVADAKYHANSDCRQITITIQRPRLS